jgi:alpha-galactosidase
MKKCILLPLLLTIVSQLYAGETNGVNTPYILTPLPSATPRINGANVFGVRPGSPFLFTIPATGERPVKFSADNLPNGLKLDSETGRITGSLKTKGEFIVILQAKNSLGTAEKKLRIVCGDQIALTPPMGWNSWNCFASAVSADKVKRAADAMVKSGLINHGWTYINIVDYWQNHRDSNDSTLRGEFRDSQGNIKSNKRFPDMKGLADYVHELGLKIGLYSSPGPWTCGGCAGSFGHEEQDAQTYARWGFDYLKYDWCSYAEVADGKNTNITKYPQWGKGATDLEVASYPYQLMEKFLREQKRDIVYSLCQYGMADVWKWGGSVGGNCWRTTGDIVDLWDTTDMNWQGSVSGIGFNQDKAAPYAKPGNWNDPDMLVVGEVGWGRMHPSRLTPDEQYAHISLWCLLSAPLLIGCDMEKFDDFTLNLLGNDEVLALDQDALGKQATCMITNGDVRVYGKVLEDGGRALGFFNLGKKAANLEFKDFASLGLTGKQQVRDLWRQQNLDDLDTAAGVLPLTIPAHGVLLYKLMPINQLRAATETKEDGAINVKWFPGHYLTLASTEPRETWKVISGEKKFVGGQRIYTWRQLEPEKGQYDFSAIEADLALLHRQQQRLFLEVWDNSFDGKTMPVPDYLLGAEYKGGIARPENNKRVTRTKRWVPAVMDRYLLLVEALGKHFDNNPDFAGFIHTETAMEDKGDGFEDYSGIDFDVQMHRLIAESRKAFPHTPVIVQGNWYSYDGLAGLMKLAEYAEEEGVGWAGPDLVPGQDIWGYEIIKRKAGKMPLGLSAQWDSYKGKWTAKQLLDFAVNDMKLNFIFWGSFNRRTGGGLSFRGDILPSVNAYAESPSAALPVNLTKK